jgi:hypothetical protein
MKIKTAFGYNVISIGQLDILTIKVKMKNSFPVHKLPLGFKHRQSIRQDEIVIEFVAINSISAVQSIERFDALRLQYKLDQVINNHGGWSQPKGYLQGDVEASIKSVPYAGFDEDPF